MVLTRRGASLLNQNTTTFTSTTLPIQSKSTSSIKRSRSHSSSSSSSSSIIHPLTQSKSKSKSKSNKIKKNPSRTPDSHHPNSIHHSNQPQDEGNQKKKSVFGFHFDSSSISISNFNPTLCYDFSTSFLQPNLDSKKANSIQNKPSNSTSTLHQSTSHSSSNQRSSIKPNPENDEFETMKSAISTITQFLATSNDDPNHTLSIFEGIMSDPVMRARVPNQLLRDYETALIQKPGCTKQMILIDKLVAATGTATRLAKELMRRKQQIRNSSIHNHHPTTQSFNRGDPLTEYNLSQCESISPQILLQHQQQQQEKESSSQVNLNQKDSFLQLGPPIQLRQSNSNQESGFDVQSVTPTIIEANPSTSPQTLTIQANQTQPNLTQTQQINQLQTILNQSTSMNISSIQDSNSIESQRLSKAKSTLTAIRLQSGEEEAKEVYAGFQLMVVYELIGILSTELWSNLYDQYLIENDQRNNQVDPPTGLLASGSGSGNGNPNVLVINDNDNPNPSGSGSGGYMNLNQNQSAP